MAEPATVAVLPPPADDGSTDEPVTTAQVVERYQRMVYAICLTHTACRGDADDVFQEVFLTYHRKQPVLNGADHRQAWLIRTTLTIARRVATDSWRTRVVPLRPEDVDQAAAVVFTAGDERADRLFQALNRLSPTYRSVVHLFYFEDLSVAAIAALLDLDPAAVKMRLSRGRAKLRQALSEEDSDV